MGLADFWKWLNKFFARPSIYNDSKSGFGDLKVVIRSLHKFLRDVVHLGVTPLELYNFSIERSVFFES